jgi:hypothetical protein
MTAIAVEPILLNDAHVSSVQFVPTSNVVTWKGMTPTSKFSAATAPTWVCNLGYAQDWETENSLSQYLMDHAGEKVTAEFHPKAGGAGYTASVLLAAGPIGGDGDAVAVGTVSLGVDGEPTKVAEA